MSDIDRFWKFISPEPNSGCWLWTGAWSRHVGYGCFQMKRGGKWKSVHAHRASWILHNGEIPPKTDVCHKCDVRLCANPGHLFLGTRGDNVADMYRKGRDRHVAPKGGAHRDAKVTDDLVREIRRRASQGVQYKIMAEDYGLHPSTIRVMVMRRTWRHVA